MNWREKKISNLKGVSKEKAKLLQSDFNLVSYYDLLFNFPYRYDDRSTLFTTTNAPIYKNVQIKGKILNLKQIVSEKGKKRLSAIFKDKCGIIELVWFKITKQLIQSIYQNIPVVIYGKLSEFNNKLSISHPEVELYSIFINKKMKFSAKYSLTETTLKKGITNRWYQSIYKNLFDEIDFKINENLSPKILKKFHLILRNEALKNIHLPENQFKLKQAQYRLKFEEIFFFQLEGTLRKLIRMQNKKGNSCKFIGFYFNEFYKKHLSFNLTNAQKRVIKEIRYDMKKSIQMNRLLQGDVSSGKTVVALLSMLIAIDNGFQTCLMAPTEILATQHFYSISELVFPLGITVELLSGSTHKKKRNKINQDLQEGKLKILIGTHALLEDKIQFKNLGLAIIDEQHRFGVAQRAKLWSKNVIFPHVLVMTATPIPRTLAMSYYADLDLSIIDELPKERKPIQTLHVYETKRIEVIKFLKNQIDKGYQAYYVYPLIEESEVLEYKNLIDGFDFLSQQFPTPNYNISVVHGRMTAKEKKIEMQKFIQKKTQLMVATTVIEVGVNIPNASIIVIENAERFGLSQLHQIRGRVGRGKQQSYCILLTKLKFSKEAKIRIKTMCKTNDGFKISEVDLELRGAGNILGTQQSGIINFKLINFIKDKNLIHQVKQYVDKLLELDPNLDHHPKIKNFFLEEYLAKIQSGKSIDNFQNIIRN